MDNAQDVDRIEAGGRLFSISPAKRHITKHSGSLCNGGKISGLNTSKKDQRKKLDVVGEDNLMACVGSDVEEGHRPGNGSCKRFKSPRVFLDDCNTVYQPSVPRKLRSAMRKRSNESVAPPLVVSKKKLKHVADGVGLLRNDGLVTSNLNKTQAKFCLEDSTVGIITKDEEEVAEALYALAVVFPDAAKTDKKKLAGKSKQSGASSSALARTEDSICRSKETGTPKTDVEPKRVHLKDDKPKRSSNILDSATEVKLPSLNGTKQPDISVCKQLIMESGSDSPEVNLPLTAFVSENECAIKKPCEFVSNARTELSFEHGSKLLKPEKSLAISKHPAITSEFIGATTSQPMVKCITEESRDTGSSLCLGFSSRTTSDPECTRHLAWFGSSSSVERSAISDSIIAKKDDEVVTNSKKSWKRCSTHVYISCFIKDFQMTDGRDRFVAQYRQIKTNEGPRQGPHDTSDSPACVRNGLTESISTKGTHCSVPGKDGTEMRNAILLHKQLLQDQHQSSTTSGINSAQNQSLDYPSLTTGSRMERVNSSNKPRQGPEALSPLPLPCLQSQYQPAVSFPMSKTYYSPTSFSGYPSAAAAQQVHLPSFLGKMLPTAGDVPSTSSQQEQRQQQKQALLMTHYRPGVASPNFPDWQSGLSDLAPMLHHSRILFPPSSSSGEAIGSKYSPIIQHQQHHHHHQQSVSPTASLPPSTITGQYHRLPPIFEGNVGGSHSAYADNLQSAYLKC